MNSKQKQIFRKLADIFSKHDLGDIDVALAAFRNDDLLTEIAESAARTKRATKRSSKESATKKRTTPQDRLMEVEQEISEDSSEETKLALLVSKKLLDKTAFSGAPKIRGIFQDLEIAVGKSVSDRSQLVMILFTALKNERIERIKQVAEKLDENSSQNSSLSDWSKVINRKDDSAR